MVCQVSDRPGVDKEPRVRDLNLPRRAAVVASAQNVASEDPFVKSKRSLYVGYGEKLRDANPLSRRHLIALLFDFYCAHGSLLSIYLNVGLSGNWKRLFALCSGLALSRQLSEYAFAALRGEGFLLCVPR
jgi:hypothetical protein